MDDHLRCEGVITLDANLASRSLGLCLRRLSSDFEHRYGYRPYLVETFVARSIAACVELDACRRDFGARSDVWERGLHDGQVGVYV